MMDVPASPTFIQSIIDVCNEPLVYSLFQERLNGAPYTHHDALDFYNWGIRGWKNNTHFLFIATDKKGRATAACDIKSANVNAAEIGYWSSAHHRGSTTNAVNLMIQAGFQAGFQCLYALVRPENTASARVLIRVGFEADSTFATDTHDSYVIFNS